MPTKCLSQFSQCIITDLTVCSNVSILIHMGVKGPIFNPPLSCFMVVLRVTASGFFQSHPEDLDSPFSLIFMENGYSSPLGGFNICLNFFKRCKKERKVFSRLIVVQCSK